MDDAVENRFPVLVAAEIVVSDEKVGDAVRPMIADCLLDVIARAGPRLLALDVYDGAERALKWTASTCVEGSKLLNGPTQVLGRQNWCRLGFQRGQVFQIVINRLDCTVRSITQDHIHPTFEFASKHTDAEVGRRL